MKFALALVAATFVILPVKPANADFVPGRVRAHEMAQMQVVKAAGLFSQVKAAQVALNYEDGKPEVVSVTIEIPGEDAMTLPLRSVKRSECGDRYEFRDFGGPWNFNKLGLVDYRRATCELALDHMWDVSVTRGNDLIGAYSMELIGTPEALMLTL